MALADHRKRLPLSAEAQGLPRKGHGNEGKFLHRFRSSRSLRKVNISSLDPQTFGFSHLGNVCSSVSGIPSSIGGLPLVQINNNNNDQRQHYSKSIPTSNDSSMPNSPAEPSNAGTSFNHNMKDDHAGEADSLHSGDEGAHTPNSTPPTELDEVALTAKNLAQVWEWNSPVPPTLTTCMHDLISQHAKQHPDRAAVNSWDGDFTYREVEDYSNSLALRLISIGVGLGKNVPVLFEKSKWTCIAVLAIMKAGGTFALMDPSQPEGRLRTIVEQTGAFHILTSQAQEALGRRAAPNAKLVVVAADQFDLNDISPDPKLPDVPASTNLYIQFTSGSTGKPKGCLVTHENYTSGAIPRADLVGYREHSRVLDFASYAFDVCIDCMLCTLSNGGCLCIPTEADRVNDLSGAIRKMKVNMAHMTPSVARVLDSDIIPSLEVLGLGGEAISNGDALRWGKETQVVNAYGPSECTVGCTINNKVGRDGKKQVTIGKGVGGAIWIVDPADHNRLVPLGAVGELIVEGAIVGPGYLGDAEKTDAVFISDPDFLVAGCNEFPGRHGRCYKTGDLVKYDIDGSIIFVGRGDQQVKLRGQRIELAEIEHHMRDKLPPETRVAAEVIKPGGASGEPMLVAFISDNAGLVSGTDSLLGSFSPAVTAALADMNKALSEYLPIYMVPAAYIPLHTMPLLVSAKTDRKQLREIGAAMSRRDLSGFAAALVQRREPSTEMEQKLAEIWGNVLGPDGDFSATDNFFSVGGDSLKAMKLVAAARAQGISLSVAGIFGKPVLEDMAQIAQPTASDVNLTVAPFSLLSNTWSSEAAKEETAELCGINADDVEDVYPCTPLQEALMALSAKVTEAYVAQRVVEMTTVNANRLAEAFKVAASDCPILRTRIVQIAGQGLMQVVVKDDFSCPVLQGHNLSEFLASDRNDPVELGKPLVRYAIVADEKTTGKTHFVLTMHHALYDGWSMPLVVERVNNAYNGLTTDRPASFKNFIKWLCDMDRKDSETYWRERLDGADGEQFPALPYPGYQQQANSLLEHYVPVENRVGGTTVATAIRGAWALLVASYTASNDVVFGETLTGRNAPIPGVEQIEGPMIATIPVRVAVNVDATVSEYLQEIHDQSVLAIPHEHFGLQHIRRLSPDAREACELRTGFVLHPSVEGDVTAPTDEQPANGFVPAGDDEAAQEALKFNTYALMLVCSLDPKGFLIMASFDSNTVASPQMQKMLSQLGRLTQQFCQSPNKRLGDLQVLDAAELTELARLSRLSGGSPACSSMFPSDVQVTEAWIVDPSDTERLSPVGATGELLVHCLGDPELESIDTPKWLPDTVVGKVYRTRKLAKYNPDGSIVRVEKPIKEKKIKVERSNKLSVSSEKQKRLRHAWSRILAIPEDEIGLEDSFFLLGGDSIGAMKLVSETRVEGFELTVKDVFKHRTLHDMANVLKEAQNAAKKAKDEVVTPFSLIGLNNINRFLEIQKALAQPDWVIQDVYPTRPLQQVAVYGTVKLPRYSTRYELFHLDGEVDRERLLRSCQDLVAQNEILRTVFIENEGQCLGVVLKSLTVKIDEFDIEGNIEKFAHNLCNTDVQTRMPLGSAFVKFMLVRGENGRSCLIIRISHAQYDEICLVPLLRQLGALYDELPFKPSAPFSNFVYHTLNKTIPQSIPYWKELLKDSELSVLRPELPLKSRIPDAVTRTVSIAARLKDITVATLPTAAWALCLAKRLGRRDVVFGEVVSGRNTDLANVDSVMGPTWQYVPVRVKFEQDWTGLDLLDYIQHQHIASAQHEGMGLAEIVPQCTDWPKSVDWFDSVVHQDVYHVEEMKFGKANCRMETVYPHYEPLKEWKIQAFVKGDELMFEVVTFADWIPVANELLDELEKIMELLVTRPKDVISW